MKKESFGIVQIVLAEFFIAVVYIMARVGRDFGNYNLAFFRIFLAAFFVGLLFFVSRKYHLAPLRYQIGKLIFFGAIHGFIIIAAFISLNTISIASSVLLQSTIALFTAIFSIFLLKERLTIRVLIAIVISFVGMFFLFTPQTFFLRENMIGGATGLFVGVFGGLVYAMSKTFKKYDKISLTFWQNLIALPFILPLLFLEPIVFSLNNSVLVVFMGVFAALSFIFLYKGLGKVKGTKASVLTLLYAVFSILIAAVLFKELPMLKEVIGGVLILFAAYLSTSQ